MFIHTGLGDDENCDGTPVQRSASSTNNIRKMKMKST